MKRRIFFAWCAGFAFALTTPNSPAIGGAADELPAILSQGRLLSVINPIVKADRSGPDHDGLILSVIATEDSRYPGATRADATRTRTVPYGMQVIVRPKGAFQKGDKIVITWVARNGGTQSENGEVPAELLLQGPKTPKYYVRYAFNAGKEWKRYFVSFEASAPAADNDLKLAFWIGMHPMKLDLAQAAIYRFPSETPLATLPTTAISYEGREPNALWRQAAAERIEKTRKGDFTIRVVDQAGKPVGDADVNLAMLRHAFPFGCVADETSFGKTGPDANRMKLEFGKLFNYATVGRMTWICWWRPDVAYQARRHSTVDWLEQNHFAPWHGSHLVWPGTQYIPPPVITNYLTGCKTNPEAAKRILQQAVRAQVELATRTYAGRVDTWNVINELYEQHWLIDQVGTNEMFDYFRIARRNDPKARLIINDYGILSHGGGWVEHQDAYFNLAKTILAAGAPIDGIGFQGHFGSQLTPPGKLLAILDRFGSLGLGLQVTEFDLDIADEAVQADYLRDFLTVVFSHPAVTGIEQWGFWEGDHWKPAAALWRKDWSIKPSGQAYLDLVFRDWWTQAQGKSSGAGDCTLRGFYGQYRITASRGTASTQSVVTFTKANRTATITLP